MVAPPFEADFLGALTRDDHGLWELFQSVGRYHPDATNEEVLAIGRALLERWVRRGWIETVTRHGAPRDVGELARFVAALDLSDLQPVEGAPWLRLTARGDAALRNCAWTT